MLAKTNPTDKVSLPTQEEIIELYGLLQQTRATARDVNFPLSFALTSAATSLMAKFIEEPIVSLITAVGSNFPPALIGLAAAAYYQKYQAYQWSSSLASYVFPWGIGFNKHLSITADPQEKILTAAEVRKLLPELRSLLQSQRSIAQRNHRLSLAVSLILPLVNALQLTRTEDVFLGSVEGLSLTLSLGLLGPYLTFINSNSPPLLPKFISDLACAQQSASYVKFFYGKWSARKLPEQITLFSSRLNQLACSAAQWQKVDNVARYGKDALMFSLQIPGQTTSFVNEAGRRCEISSFFYSSLLHRALLDAGLSAYILADNFLLVGFANLPQRTSDKFRKKLLKQLAAAVELEETCRINLTRLNQKVSEILNLKANAWQAHYDYDAAAGHFTLCYFIDKKRIPDFIMEEFLDFLRSITPAGCVQNNQNSIVLNKLAKHINDFNRLLTKLQQAYKAKFIDSDAAPAVRDSYIDRPVKRKAETKKVAVEDKALPQTKIAANIYPAKINFTGGYSFFHPAPTEKPPKFAYPLHLPWLPEGRAYACVDPKVFKVVEGMLSKKAIIANLEHGALHTVKGQASGIQTKLENYKAVDGNYYASSFQMKFANNIGIFARKLQLLDAGEGRRYELYEFNGPGYRH